MHNVSRRNDRVNDSSPPLKVLTAMLLVVGLVVVVNAGTIGPSISNPKQSHLGPEAVSLDDPPYPSQPSGPSANDIPRHPGPIPVSSESSSGTVSGSTPPGYNGHYYAGGEYYDAATTGTILQTSIYVPNDTAISGDNYYVILSVWDNNNS